MTAATVTQLLQQLSAGNQELERIARGQLRNECPGHTLQATALVHEAYLETRVEHGAGLAAPRTLLRLNSQRKESARLIHRQEILISFFRARRVSG
jgi:hypothetical protein